MNDKKLIKSGINKCVNIERIYIVGKSWWEETRLVDCLPLGRGATKRGVAGGKWKVASGRRKDKVHRTKAAGKRICPSGSVVILRLLALPGRVFVLPFGLKCSCLILPVRVIPAHRMLPPVPVPLLLLLFLLPQARVNVCIQFPLPSPQVLALESRWLAVGVPI